MDDLDAFDALWDLADPAASEARFRVLLSDPRMTATLACEVQTQIARTLILRQRCDEARALLDALVPCVHGDCPRVRIRWLLEYGRSYASAEAGEGRPVALQLYVGAWALARAHGQNALAIDAARMAALVAPTPAEQDAWQCAARALAADVPATGAATGNATRAPSPCERTSAENATPDNAASENAPAVAAASHKP